MSDHHEDDTIRLRSRQRSADDQASQDPGVAARGAPCLVAHTKSVTSYPSAASRYFACEAEVVTGTETEGSTGVLTINSGTFFALNLGSVAPPVGTNLLVTFVDHRWVFRYDG